MNYENSWTKIKVERGTLLTPISGIRIAWSISFSLQQKDITLSSLGLTERSIPSIFTM